MTKSSVFGLGHVWDKNRLNQSGPINDSISPYLQPWSASHYRTFLLSYYKKINKENFLDDEGNFFKRTYDQALMLPIIHLVHKDGFKTKYIHKICYVYTGKYVPRSEDNLYQLKLGKIHKGKGDILNSFFISNLNPYGGGPHIFASRLAEELVSQGLTYSSGAKNKITLIEGPYSPGSNNILRLDNLYYHDCPENERIFDCYKKYDQIVFQADFARLQYEKFTGIKKDNTIINNGVPDYFFEPQLNVGAPPRPTLIASADWAQA